MAATFTSILVFTLAVLPAATLAGQAAPRVQPGGVATIVVAAGTGDDSLRFTLRPAEGIRLFSPGEGHRAAAPGEPVRLPFTFGLPAGAPAGRLVVSELDLVWGDGRTETRDLEVDVVARRGAHVVIGPESVASPAGRVAEVEYRIRNDGNAADTFLIDLKAPSSWPATVARRALVLAAGEERSGTLRVDVPVRASRGEEHLLRIGVAGTGVRETRSVRVIVVGEESRFGNLATVPGSIFVGSSTDGDGATAGIALTAAGEIRPGTRVTMDLRHIDGVSPAPAFRSALAGPRLRVGVEGDGWSAGAGDIFAFPDLVIGPMNHGRGVEGGFGSADLRTDVFLARPWSYFGAVEDGHILRAATRYRTDFGTFGIRAGSVHRAEPLLGEYRQSGSALTYAFRGAGHDVSAELGVLRVADAAASATGPALQLRYALNRGRLSLASRVRRVPATTARTGSHGDEAFLSGNLGLTDVVTVTGSAYATGAPRVGGEPHSASHGVAAGLRLALPAGVNGRLLGAHRSSDMVGSDLDGTATRSLSIGADIPIGAVVIEADADLGASTSGEAVRPYNSIRTGARWARGSQWAWVGLSRQDFGFVPPRTGLDLAGAVRVRNAEIQAGLNTAVNGADRLRSTSFWSGASIPLMDQTSLALGLEYRGYSAAAPWRVSIGASRRFGMPLPVARSPVRHGFVFEDLDGDGRWGPDEPAVADVGVFLGSLHTTTDAEGRFRFYDGADGRLRVDAHGLPIGVIAGTRVDTGGRDAVAIPLVRTASLELRVFLDRDADGTLDPGEDFAAGAVVSILDADGVPRDAVADASGRVRFSGLAPGAYTVTVERANGRERASPFRMDITLRPGATERMLIGVPLRSLEIRLPDGARLELPRPGVVPTATGAAEAVAMLDATQSPAITVPDRVRPVQAVPQVPVVPPVPAVRPAPPSDAPIAPSDAPTVAADTGSAPAGDSTGPGNERAPGAPYPPGGIDGGLIVAMILLVPGIIAIGIRRVAIQRERLEDREDLRDSLSPPTA